MTKQKEILATLKKELDAESPVKIVDIVLFGSQVKGTATEDSDYDILIVPECEIHWEEKQEILSIVYNIELENNILIDSKIVPKPKLYETNFNLPIVAEAMTYGTHA